MVIHYELFGQTLLSPKVGHCWTHRLGVGTNDPMAALIAALSYGVKLIIEIIVGKA